MGGSGRAKRAMPTHAQRARMNGAPGEGVGADGLCDPTHDDGTSETVMNGAP